MNELVDLFLKRQPDTNKFGELAGKIVGFGETAVERKEVYPGLFQLWINTPVRDREGNEYGLYSIMVAEKGNFIMSIQYNYMDEKGENKTLWYPCL